MSEWISVKDRLPEEYGDVLVFRVYNQRPMMSVDTYDADRKRFSKYHNGGVTHWMPLPEMPKQLTELNSKYTRTDASECYDNLGEDDNESEEEEYE